VLSSDAFCPQTAITNVEYLILQRPLAIGNTLSISVNCIRLTFCQSCPYASNTGFCNNADFSKYSLMTNSLRNALLMLLYRIVSFTVFCSYLGTVLNNRNELIRDIAGLQSPHQIEEKFKIPKEQT
jgi:hypothetical protein